MHRSSVVWRCREVGVMSRTEQWEQAELSGGGCRWALNSEVHLVSALKELPIYQRGS